jgi:hypothetical protein
MAIDRLRTWTLSPGTAAAVLILALTSACTDAPQSRGSRVTGVVAAAKTAQGIPNLVVALIRDGTVLRTVPTNSAGEFAFDGVEEGEYTARLTGVEISGLSPLHTALTPVEQEIIVESEPLDLTFAVVGLVPAHIVGEVYCGGRPAVGAGIRVVGGGTDATVETDAVGRYGATDLAPGSYTVMAVNLPCTVESAIQIVSLGAGQSTFVNFAGP